MNVSPLPPYVRCISGWLKDNSGSLVGAGGNLLGGIAGGIFSGIQSRKQREWQEDMYNRQLADTRQMRDEAWNRQDKLLQDERRYNSPANQIALAKAAGLNPALTQGGQLTDALTSVSGTGSSPDAPSPGNYVPASLPSSLSSIGTSAISAGAESRRLQIEQQNADTARINAEVNKFLSTSENLLNMANAGLADKNAARMANLTLFEQLEFPAKLRALELSTEGLQWDNLLKQFDFEKMRPAVLAEIQATTASINQDIEQSKALVELYGSETEFNRGKLKSLKHTNRLTINTAAKEKALTGYFRAYSDLLDAKLPVEEWKAANAQLIGWLRVAGETVDMATDIGELIIGGKSARFLGKGVGKTVGKGLSDSGKADWSAWKTDKGKRAWQSLGDGEKSRFRSVLPKDVLDYLESK